MHIPDIDYLRWARRQAGSDAASIALTLSGMPPPDSSFVEGVHAAELLGFPVADHPPLAETLAAEWGVEPERILLQPGTHWSLLLLMVARLESHPGPAVVEMPAYEPLHRIPQALGAEVLPLPRSRESSFALDLEALWATAERKPSLLVLTTPHNPSGAVLGPVEVAAVAEWAEATGAAVISDEVYLEFLGDPGSHTLFDRVPGAVSTRSFTKVFGLGGLKVCGSIGPREWIARAARITDYGPIAVSGPSQALAHRAWARREELWARARRRAAEGRRLVQEWMREMEGLVEAQVPEAGIICFPTLQEPVHRACLQAALRAEIPAPVADGLDRWPDGSHLWIEALRRAEDVQLTPGAFFGEPRAFRLGYGIDPQDLREGLSRVTRFIRSAVEEA